MSVTQDDIATRAGVSRALVSLVLRGAGRVSEAKRELILRTADELGYRPNTHAAQLASHRAMILGAVVTQFHNPIFLETFLAAEEAAEARGYALLPHMGDMDRPDQEQRAIDRLLGHRVDGLILFGSLLPAAEMRQLARQVPVVVTGRNVTGVDSVAINGRAGAHMAVDHLVALGHQKIVHLDGGQGVGARSRVHGYQSAMQRHQLGKYASVVSGDYTEATGFAVGREILAQSDHPTAIFAFNDMAAFGVLAAAKERGLRVPRDLSVVGFDNTPVSSLRCIDLTTVAQPGREFGTRAVAAVLGRIQDPDRAPRPTLVSPSLIVRSSTAAAHANWPAP